MENYAQFASAEIDILDETEKSSDEILDLARIAVQDHSSASARLLYFMNIEEVESVVACTGELYFLTIRVVDGFGKQEEIKKMIWKGNSMEVRNYTTYQSDGHDYQGEEFKHKFWKNSASDVAHHLKLLTLTSVLQEESPLFLPMGSTGHGFMKFDPYTVIFEANDTKKGEIVTVRALMLLTEVLVIIEGEIEASFLTWRDKLKYATTPPIHTDVPSQGIRRQLATKAVIGGFECYGLDLMSPQIVTQAWFAVEHHNFENKTKLEFVNVESANCITGTGTTYHLTLRARDGPRCNTFTTTVHDIQYTGMWKSTIPLTQEIKKKDKSKLRAQSRTQKQKQKHFELDNPGRSDHPNLFQSPK